MAASITEEIVEIDGVRVFVRRREGAGAPVVFVHGNPTNSDDWLPFMERLDAPAIAFDLPGFGRSGRPDPGWPMEAHARFIGQALDRLSVADYSLVVHDWGGIALAPASAQPDRVRKVVVINSVPLLPGYRWHWVARLWRQRIAGELFALGATRATTALVLRQAMGDRSRPPADLVERAVAHLDRGMRRAILALYRSADIDRLAAAGEHLDRLSCPGLVVWGGRDPYLPREWGPAYAEALPGARLEELPGAGHWPWLDDPGVVDRVARFLAG